MPIEKRQGVGLIARETEYEPLKPFATGGFYWDAGFQNLIRNYLGTFLPAVSRGKDQGGPYAAFRASSGPSEPLLRSFPIGNRKVPTAHLRSLRDSLDQFKAVANASGTQPDYRALITKFQLPDPQKEPELYRFSGPFWNRRLHILWGCERTRNSSLPADEAVSALPEDKLYNLTQFLAGAALLLLLLCLLAACLWGWPTLKQGYARTFNTPPIAALRLDSVDETNRVATISDDSSHSPDGTLKYWRIAWGDGKEDSFTTSPQKIAHTYGSERDYTISLWCVDNYSVTSSPPALTNISFDLIKRQKAFEEAQLEAQRIKDDAKKEAAQLKAEAQKQKDLAAQQAEGAKKEQELADKKKADAEKAQQEAKQAQEAADQAKTNGLPVAQTPPSATQPPLPQQPASIQSGGAQPGAASPDVLASDPPPGAPSRNEPSGKGATDLLRRDIEILKGRAGRLAADNTLEAILVVRDKAHANTTLDVVEWVVDGKAYHTGNAQFTTHLSITEHVVSVRVRHLGNDSIAKAKVVVTGAQTQTTEPDFIVAPLR